MGRIRTVILVLGLLVPSLLASGAGPVRATAAAVTTVTAATEATTAPLARSVPKPIVRRVAPVVGSVRGGNTVTVRGSRFRQVTAVRFGARKGTQVRVLGPRRLTVRAPAHAPGRVRVTVTTRSGTSSARVVYRYQPAPVIGSTALPTAVTGQAYRFVFSVADRRSGTWRVAAGSLPAGLRLSTTGVLAGVPTAGATSTSATVGFTDTRGSTATRRVRVVVLSPRTWSTVETGTVHACALGTDRSIWCWGQGFAGQLGNGSTAESATRVPVGTATDWVTLTSGSFTSCATKTDGTAWCWGSNGAGQVGNGTTQGASAPAQVGSDTDWASLDGGNNHTCGLRTDGTAWCWGANNENQLGVTTPTSFVTTPVQVGSDTDWASISAGVRDTCAIKLDGTAWCWGANGSGQHGDGTTQTHPTPVQVGSGTTWATISVGSDHTCATRTDGTAWCWGANGEGKLGNGSTEPSTTPVQVGTGTTWGSIATADVHTCATSSDGDAFCWGGDGSGQLGDGERGPGSTTPTRVVSGISWASVTGGLGTSCGATTGGEVYCWGNGINGERGDGRGGFEPVPSRLP